MDYVAVEDIPDAGSGNIVRSACRTCLGGTHSQLKTDDDPNHVEEVSLGGDAAYPTDVKPDTSENPPESTNLSAVAQ